MHKQQILTNGVYNLLMTENFQAGWRLILTFTNLYFQQDHGGTCLGQLIPIFSEDIEWCQPRKKDHIPVSLCVYNW